MTHDGPERSDLEDKVDQLEEKVLGEVVTQDRHDEHDENSAEPAIEQDIDDDDFGRESAGSESSD